MEEALLIVGVLVVYGLSSYFNAKITEKKLFAVKYGVMTVFLAVIFSFEETTFALMLIFAAGMLNTLRVDLKNHFIPLWKAKQF